MTDSEKPPLARVRRPKEPLHLVHQTAEAEAVVIPALSPDETLEARGIEVTKRVTAAYMTAAEVYYAIHQEKLWERRQYADPAPYLEERIGIAYRTYMQAVLVWSAHLAVAEGERPDVRAALEEVGVYRASVISPIIREQPGQWRAWTDLAADKGMTREALQERVSKARGLPPAHSKKAEDRLYNAFIALLDRDQREEAETIIRAGMRVGETKDFFVVVYLALIEAAPAWLAQEDRITRGLGNA